MNVRRVFILSITILAAGFGGYALLGLRAPRQAPAASTAQVQAGSRPTIIAVGPDGTLYALRAPLPSGGNAIFEGYGAPQRTQHGEFDHGYEHE